MHNDSLSDWLHDHVFDEGSQAAERGTRLPEECRGILGHAQGIGADRADGMTVKAAQTLAETIQAVERALLRFFIEALVAGQSGAKPDRLAQRIERVDLVPDGARHLEMEGV